MLISFLSNTIELISVPTETELKNRLKAISFDNLIFGEDEENKDKFYLLIANLNSGRIDCPKFCLGICAEHGSLTPQLLLWPKAELLVLGFNQEAVGVSLKNRKMCFKLVFDSYFYSFLHLPHLDFVMGIHEIGVIAFNSAGRMLWEYDKDVITEFFFDNNKLNLKFMDSPSVALRLSDGQVVS